MIEYVLEKKHLKIDDIISFIFDVDKDFVPRLSERIDITTWVHKFYPLSNIIAALDEGKIAGLIIFYANDTSTCKGYVTFVSVSPSYQKRGIATTLIRKSIIIMKDAGMKTVGIDTNNVNAMNLYRKVGFNLVSQQPLPEYDLTRFYLEKQL